MHTKAGALENKLTAFHNVSDKIDGLVDLIESYEMGIIKNKKNTYQNNQLVTSDSRD